MQLSMTTDYATSTGDPEPYLRRIADAGFSHVHWCHQWDTDFLYSRWEVEHIEGCLDRYGLELLDLHASHGQEKRWTSPVEYERRAGVELVQNRIEMTARLGGQVIIIHVPADPGNVPVRKSLDQLERFACARGIRIAVENGEFAAIEPLLEEYDRGYLGLCYDSGHGNHGAGLDRLEALKDRLISVHMHDNDGVSDLHRLPFTGTTDWQRLAQIVAQSSYARPVSLEVSMRHSDIRREDLFLERAFAAGVRLSDMIGHASARPVPTAGSAA